MSEITHTHEWPKVLMIPSLAGCEYYIILAHCHRFYVQVYLTFTAGPQNIWSEAFSAATTVERGCYNLTLHIDFLAGINCLTTWVGWN